MVDFDSLIDKLEFVIDDNTQNLERYSELPNANTKYINEKNRNIQMLTEVYNGIIELEDINRVVAINILEKINELKKQDPEINSIVLNYKISEGYRIGYLSFNEQIDEKR